MHCNDLGGCTDQHEAVTLGCLVVLAADEYLVTYNTKKILCFISNMVLSVFFVLYSFNLMQYRLYALINNDVSKQISLFYRSVCYLKQQYVCKQYNRNVIKLEYKYNQQVISNDYILQQACYELKQLSVTRNEDFGC
ncbi:Hypothetical_protein [Hexamita inflata]|uniref:Hypothetical_protein n=1 Tax=Hexamita inflata TaxID=28002 RepID=A0AA86NBN5_9EUKA|nr:Hypothetical protein HINF_LOCUS4048 [Hexamita inflata]